MERRRAGTRPTIQADARWRGWPRRWRPRFRAPPLSRRLPARTPTQFSATLSSGYRWFGPDADWLEPDQVLHELARVAGPGPVSQSGRATGLPPHARRCPQPSFLGTRWLAQKWRLRARA